MKPRSILVLAFSSLFLIAGSASAIAPMTASLDGAQETPPNGSTATGQARFVIDTTTDRLVYHVSFSGLTTAETAAHIHGYAGPGTPAGVVFPLALGSPKIGVWNYPAANEAQILAGLTYVNIHTSTFPGGEIRGQIVADTNANMVALLDAAQETPPNASPGLGVGIFKLDTVANTLTYDVRFGLLGSAETAAHIHGFAAPGTPAGVLFPLALGSPKIGVWNYMEAQEANIQAGLTYVNIHTSTFPGGEIRGQIITPTPATDAPSIPAAVGSSLSLTAAPNPIAPGRGDVVLFYRAPSAGDINVVVYDAAGRAVRRIWSGHGEAQGILSWDARDDAGSPVAAGVYFARIEAQGKSETRAITVLK